MNKIITIPEAPVMGPYSHAVQVGGLLFSSGQIALDPSTGKLVEGGIEAEVRQVFANMQGILSAAGLGFEHIVKTTVFLTDFGDFPVLNTAFAEFFPENPPARSCVEVCALPAGARVEIELIASIE